MSADTLPPQTVALSRQFSSVVSFSFDGIVKRRHSLRPVKDYGTGRIGT